MIKNNLAVIIATKDRPQELSRLLESIKTQEVKPSQIIVVDGSDSGLTGLLSLYSYMGIDYIKVIPPSLTKQRNVGISAVKDDAVFVAFFDDDIALEENSLRNMMKFWENASQDTAGACFNNMSEPFKKPRLGERIFLVNANTPGRITRSGFQSIPCAVDKTMRVDWLIGCAMVYRKSIFKKLSFDEWFYGYARYEDVDFSYRVGREHKMFVVADAKIKHFVKLEKIESSFALARMEVVNRMYFVKKNHNLSSILCCWSILGILINNVIKALSGKGVRYKLRARGSFYGFVEVFLKMNFK